MKKVINDKPQMLPKHLPTAFNSATVQKINKAVNNIVQNNATTVNQQASAQSSANNNVPVLDLTSNATTSPAQQIANMMYTSSPQRAHDINAVVQSDHTVNNIIKNHGHFDTAQALNLPSSNDIDGIYRDIYAVDTNDSNTNEFMRLEKMFTAITGLSPDLVNTGSTKGLFSNIDEHTMSSLYQIMYGEPMNYSDYHYYLLYGNQNNFNNNDFGQLTNNTADGSHLAKFNELKPDIAEIPKISYSLTSDKDYRTLTNTPNSTVHNQPINPIVSSKASQIGFNEISWVLQLPFKIADGLPVEAATYLTSINVSPNRIVSMSLPRYQDFDLKHRLEKVNLPHSFTMSECTLEVLQDILRHVHITYNGLAKTSLIAKVEHSALKDDYPVIYTLVKKTVLDLYSLCFALLNVSYLKALTYKALIQLRINIRYLKAWSSHFWEYRDFIEIWNDLDEAVAFIIPKVNSALGNVDSHYNMDYFNDNSINAPVPDDVNDTDSTNKDAAPFNNGKLDDNSSSYQQIPDGTFSNSMTSDSTINNENTGNLANNGTLSEGTTFSPD